MKEIKFRAWDLNNEKMYDSYCVDSNGSFCVNGDFGNNCECSETDKVIQMQFTGLKDRNGKDIYEGDIINFDGTVLEITLGEETLTLGYKILKAKDENVLEDIRLYRTEESAEIMGNVYENEELLEDKA
jgi:uncharacterized phage protein (TIGR01671 family)